MIAVKTRPPCSARRLSVQASYRTGLVCLLVVFALAAPSLATAQTNDHAGLWVGMATVNGMSRVNKATADFSFDLVLSAADGRALIPAGAADWRYLAAEDPAYAQDPSLDPFMEPGLDAANVDWISLTYDDSSWPQGTAAFGFGDGDEATVLSFSSATWPRTVYFRQEFTPGATGMEQLTLQLLCDDGAVVYLNSQEVLRVNMPVGIIGYDTAPSTAVGPSEEGHYVVHEIDLLDNPGLLLQDTSGQINVLTVEVHQHPSELRNPTVQQPEVTPSASAFNLRVLLHSDASSGVKLLKEVYRMHDEVAGAVVPVLLASDTLIPDYTGPGSRVSTAAYDFDGSTVACVGAASATGQVTCDFDLRPNHPTNPFLHRYHPDHDNWDPRYESHYPENPGAPEESFTVERTIQFTFEERYPPGCEGADCRRYPPPGWGESILGGSYTESLRGLHRDDITVSGTFKLERVSPVSAVVE